MIRSFLSFSVGAALLIVAGPCGAVDVPHRERITGTAKAVEGDVLDVSGRLVRLMGIDAPDAGQICRNRYGSPYDCGSIAKGVLDALVTGRSVSCVLADRDRTGMEVGECRADGVDLGAAMVARGWAFAFRSLSSAYQNNEAYAQSRRFGVWSGMVQKPWEWRSQQLRARSR